MHLSIPGSFAINVRLLSNMLQLRISAARYLVLLSYYRNTQRLIQKNSRIMHMLDFEKCYDETKKKFVFPKEIRMYDANEFQYATNSRTSVSILFLISYCIQEPPSRIKKISFTRKHVILVSQRYTIVLLMKKDQSFCISSFDCEWPKSIQCPANRIKVLCKGINEALKNHDKALELIDFLIFSHYLFGQFLLVTQMLKSRSYDFHYRLKFKGAELLIQFGDNYQPVRDYKMSIIKDHIMLSSRSPLFDPEIKGKTRIKYKPGVMIDFTPKKEYNATFLRISFQNADELDVEKIITKMCDTIIYTKLLYLSFYLRPAVSAENPPLVDLDLKIEYPYVSLGHLRFSFNGSEMATLKIDRRTGKTNVASNDIVDIFRDDLITTIEHNPLNIWRMIGCIVQTFSQLCCLRTHFHPFSAINQKKPLFQVTGFRQFYASYFGDYVILVLFQQQRPTFSLYSQKKCCLIDRPCTIEKETNPQKIHVIGMNIFNKMIKDGILRQIKDNLRKLNIHSDITADQLHFFVPEYGNCLFKLKGNGWKVCFPLIVSPITGTFSFVLISNDKSANFTYSIAHFISKFINFHSALKDFLKCIVLNKFFSDSKYSDISADITLPDKERHRMHLGIDGYKTLDIINGRKYRMTCHSHKLPHFATYFYRYTIANNVIRLLSLSPSSINPLFPFCLCAPQQILKVSSMVPRTNRWTQTSTFSLNQLFVVFNKQTTININMNMTNQLSIAVPKTIISFMRIPLLSLSFFKLATNVPNMIVFQGISFEQFDEFITTFDTFMNNVELVKGSGFTSARYNEQRIELIAQLDLGFALILAKISKIIELSVKTETRAGKLLTTFIEQRTRYDKAKKEILEMLYSLKNRPEDEVIAIIESLC